MPLTVLQEDYLKLSPKEWVISEWFKDSSETIKNRDQRAMDSNEKRKLLGLESDVFYRYTDQRGHK
jgi:hypothetical protein